MEILKNKVNNLTKTLDYRFKTNEVKKILQEFKKEFSVKENFNEAVSIDKKRMYVYVNFQQMIKIIDEQINNEQYYLKFKPDNIIDGYGNIAVRIQWKSLYYAKTSTVST